MFDSPRTQIGAITALLCVVGVVTTWLALKGIDVSMPPITVAASATPSSTPTVSASAVPATSAIEAIARRLATDLSGSTSTATLSDTSDCTAPVVSRVVSASTGSWIHPQGRAVEVAAWPAGMGPVAQSCITSADSSAKVVRAGDVLVIAEGSYVSDDLLTSALGTPAGCLDTTDSDESARAPQSDHYTGLLDSTQVNWTGATPERVTTLQATQVTVPDTPTTPHSPASLPTAPTMPATVTAPTYPASSATASWPVVDTNGPGCGWKFTGEAVPPLPANAVTRQQAVAAATKQLADDHAAYTKALAAYKKAKATFDKTDPAWEAYAKQVAEIAQKWSTQKQEWATYEANLAIWQAQVDARNAFLAQQQQAQTDYDAAMKACQQTVTITVPPSTITATSTTTTWVTPTPSAGGTASASPSTPATPTPSVAVSTSTSVAAGGVTTSAPACPTQPAILSQTAPTVGPKPVEPTF